LGKKEEATKYMGACIATVGVENGQTLSNVDSTLLGLSLKVPGKHHSLYFNHSFFFIGTFYFVALTIESTDSVLFGTKKSITYSIDSLDTTVDLVIMVSSPALFGLLLSYSFREIFRSTIYIIKPIYTP
jgi:hypothetical protein